MASTHHINHTQLALNPDQIMQLPPNEQAQYVAGLHPRHQEIFAKHVASKMSADFMRNSIEKIAYCPVTGGSGTSAAYSPGVTLSFDLPVTEGFAKALLISYNLTVTPATGTGAGYQTTPSAPYSIFSRAELDYNGPQIVTHPYLFKLQDMLDGILTLPQDGVLTGGNNDSNINSNLVGSTPLVVNSGNTWQGKMLMRLNALNPESPYGLIPINGVGNRPQLKLTCAPALFGTDPLLNAVCANGGSGNAVSVSGTISVDCVYLDGTNYDSIHPLQLRDWDKMPTVQYYWEQSLTPFNANQLNRFMIATKLEHWYALAIVIDGQQSNAFISGINNLTAFGLAPDFTGQQYFEAVNIANNISVYDYYDRKVRKMIRQDLPEGVIPWVAAPLRGVVNANNRNGSQALNMYADGFPATTHVYQVGAVGAVCTPRVELFLISKNNAGLKIS